MIRNDLHYRNEKKALEKFQVAMKELESKKAEIDEFRYKLYCDSTQSKINEINDELHEFEKLKSGEKKILSCNSINDLPLMLIQARIANNLNHKQLAEKVGLHEQQIQKYEANDYNEVKWERLAEIAYALGVGDNFNAVVDLSINKLFGQQPICHFNLGAETTIAYNAQQKVRERQNLLMGE